MTTTTIQTHSLRSSRTRPTIRIAEVFVQSPSAPSRSGSSENGVPTVVEPTLLTVPVDDRRERRRRRREKMNKPLPPTPVGNTDTAQSQEIAEVIDSRYLPRRVCKYMHRVARQEFHSVMNQRYFDMLRKSTRIAPPTSAVQSLLESRLYQQQLENVILMDSESYWKMSSDIIDAKVQDLARMGHLARHIAQSESETNEALELNEDSAYKLMDTFQEILDAGFEDDVIRQKMKTLMSSLAKKSSGLPDSMFISGVAVTRGQSSIGGTFGDIYKTVYRKQAVALKFLRILGSSSAEKRKTCKRFYKEALVWQKLDHKYVLPFLGVDTENFPGRPCMVSPWMPNGNAHDFVKSHPKINVDKLFFGIAQGLQYLHSKPIVHGDIKGCNIMIDEQWNPRLADFGLTVWADVTKQDTTQHGGTVRWMAPELLHPSSYGRKDCCRTFATDVYAYGCLCIELYTRDKPFFYITSEGAVSVRVTRGERPKRPTQPPFTDELWALITACWHGDAEMRPKCSDIVEVLKTILRRSALGDGSTNNSTTSLSPPNAHDMRRHALGGSPRPVLQGLIFEEPEEMEEDERLQREFQNALLRIRKHADPSRMYVEMSNIKKGFSVQVFQSKTSFNVPVTVKQINIERQSKSKIIQLVDEFNTLRYLHHNNLIGYIDMFRFEGELWVVNEDISDTITLKKVFRTSNNEASKREPFLLKILPSLLQALDYLHRHGINHRSLGIEDVVFTKSAQTKLKLCAMFPDPDTVHRRRVSPPELADGKDYGAKSDIWNLGLLLIEALDMEKKIDLEQQPEHILRAFKTITKPSEIMVDIVASCLKPYSALRPTAAEMLKLRPFQ